ncbi:MAG: class I poly(R)-hydroxyalkanoic acid synthase [Rhodobacterales bacterium]|nr:class I poly(R)-hydroxyalkanoic acid synthase [Rhodobacterales bacterium]
MTTKDGDASLPMGELSEDMARNLQRVEALSQRFIKTMSHKRPVNESLSGPDQELFTNAMTTYWGQMAKDPARIFAHQLDFWGKSVTHFMEAQQMFKEGKFEAPNDETATDRRFANPMWQQNPYFNYIKQQYMMNADAIRQAVQDVGDLDPVERKRLDFFSEQIINMLAPTNFLGTNPDALERAVETNGESLVQGLENLIGDLEANEGELLVRLADASAFELGKNIATTPGKVVFRNRMMELIQYAPTTEQVHSIPLVVFPPWINKFYILDLKAQNSLIKWITEQGFTLFVVAWVNPGSDYRDVGMEEYITEGYLAAFDEVKKITGQKQVNTVGYCIAGTTLNLVLALLKKRGDKTIKSATFFTALTDFGDQGEFTPFLGSDFIDGIEDEVAETGVLRSLIMARTFSFLRSNDLIYGPAIKSYMMGEAPPAFDLLFWNGDGSNLPAKMAMQYLRGLCQDNNFVRGGVEMFGETLHISDVDVPMCSIACEGDHIAAWPACYGGFQMAGGKNKTFILSQSGHIAGIINPPSKKKYGHYTNDDLGLTSQEWREGAEFHEGTWWGRWGAWLAKRSGKMIPARHPGDNGHEILCDAPGTYVTKVPTL